MNVRLLRRVQKIILSEPKRLDMSTWGERVDPKEDPSAPKCGTVGCIAGWAYMLANRVPRKFGAEMPPIWRDAGAEALDISDEQARALFYVKDWPEKFIDAYSPDGSKKSARVCARRIDHFIKTKGAE